MSSLIIPILWIFISIISSFNFDIHSVIIWLATITIILNNLYGVHNE